MIDNIKIPELPIIVGKDTIFSQEKYIIPLYQRAFTWSENEIGQLIDDICRFETEYYYLGSLIVDKKKSGEYEVIDGQQRLTALFLLLNYLEYSWGNDQLCYECRPKSNYTLNHLTELCRENRSMAQDKTDEIEQSLTEGWNIIKGKFQSDNKFLKKTVKITKEQFIEKLKYVRLFRIEVPPHTDLNRYFEIMNVRGEQLEQHDIVKEKLMTPLNDDERNAFAIVWDACRNMSGYVQMHFLDTAQRKTLFGDDWNRLYLDKIFSLTKNNSRSTQNKQTMIDIINGSELKPQNDGENNDKNPIRFNSIISFPYFLLHVLNVLTKKELPNNNYSLDDQKLVKTFEFAIEDSSDKSQFSRDFIKCLLKCRFLFDKFVIKREYQVEEIIDDNHGKWRLQELTADNNKPKYTDTSFKDKGKWETTYSKVREITHSRIMMLQACLRVSVTSPRAMHWITQLLIWLYDDDKVKTISQLEDKLEQIIVGHNDIQEFVNGDGYSGLDTPHLAFNYLDYLLWRDHKEKYKELHFNNFIFEFRNSVEHWYPQHPSDVERWDEEANGKYKRDFLGNLCIVTRGTNSRFSNLPPIAKRDSKKDIENNSLKLRIMSSLTKDNTEWRTTIFKDHGDEMLKLLRDACGVKSIPNMG